MDKYQAIKCALTIKKCGTISKAAAELYMAQPNLSRLLNDLEKELGFKLFYRTKKGLKLTKQGEYFLPEAEALIGKLDGLIQSCQPKNAAKLMISTIQSSLFVHSILGATREFPGCNLQFRECEFTEIFEDVESERVHLGLTIFPLNQKEYWKKYAGDMGLQYTAVCTSSYYLLTSQKNPYFTAGQEPDLANLKYCILCQIQKSWGIEYNFPSALFKDEYRIVDPHTRAANMDFLTSFPNGIMISFQTNQKVLEQNHLVSIPLPMLPERLEYGYLKKKGRILDKKCGEVLEYLFRHVKEELGEGRTP